jgi:hypothetical protein
MERSVLISISLVMERSRVVAVQLTPGLGSACQPSSCLGRAAVAKQNIAKSDPESGLKSKIPGRI